MKTCTEPDSICPLAAELNLHPMIEIVRQHVLGTGILVHADYGRAKELTPDATRPHCTQPAIPTRLPYRDLAFDTAAVLFSREFPGEIREKMFTEIGRLARRRIICIGPIIPWGVGRNFETNMAFKLVEGRLLGRPGSREEALILTLWDF